MIEYDYNGQYEIETVRSYNIYCANHQDCLNTKRVYAVGDIPDGWENLSKWGFDRTYCPVCKKKLQMRCVDPDVCLALDMIGAPYELDYVHRVAYEYRFDQVMKLMRDFKKNFQKRYDE